MGFEITGYWQRFLILEMERLNTQMDNSQNIYKTRTLTHNRQQLVQEASLLSVSFPCQKSEYCSSSQPRKPNYNPCNDWSQMAST